MNLRSVREAAAGSASIVWRGWPLLAIAFCVDAAFLFVFLIALQSYLPESLHQSDAIAGYALAAFGLAKLSTQLGSGFVTDRLGTRRALIAGTGLLLVADAAMLPLAHVAPWLIVGAAAIEGLGSSVTWPAVYAAGDARFEDGEKGRFTALLTLATGGALLVAMAGGTALNHVASFNVAMLAPIGAVGAAFALAAVTPAGGSIGANVPGAIPKPGEFRTVLRNAERAAFAALVLAEAMALGALTAAFRAYGRDVLEVSLARENLLLLPAAVLGGLVVVPGGAIADRVGVKRVMVPGFAVTGICLIALAGWTDARFVVVAAALAGAGFGMAVPTIAATMMSLAGSTGSRGGVIGWFMTMDGIGHSLGPALAGVLLGTLGARSVLIATGALFLGVACIALMSRFGRVSATVVEAVETPSGHEIVEGGEHGPTHSGDRGSRFHRIARRRRAAARG